MDVYELIRNAILNKQIVVATYKGRRRQMCPHVLGTKRGKPQGLFYQFASDGDAAAGPPGSTDNWRCLPIDKLEDVSVTEGEWYTSDEHSQSQTCVDTIDVQVES